MVMYLTIIFISMLLITTGNYLFVEQFVNENYFFIFLIVAVFVVVVILIDVVFATIGRWILPSKFFSIDKKWFCATKKESCFYEKIGIKKWKDKALELGAVTGFRKNKLGDATSNEYVGRFILEANYGIVVHIFCIVFGFLLLMGVCLVGCFWIILPVCIVNALLNAMTLFILRYNLPKLHALYKYNQRRVNKKI